MNEVKEKDNKETIKEETKVSESDTEESTAQERKEENNTVEKAARSSSTGSNLGQKNRRNRKRSIRSNGTVWNPCVVNGLHAYLCSVRSKRFKVKRIFRLPCK